MQVFLLEVVALGLGLLVHAPAVKRAVSTDKRFRERDIVTDYITQKLDHFDIKFNRTFQQRYMMTAKHYDKGSTAFLKVGGESEISTLSLTDDYGGNWIQNAKEFHAICFVLEHRYYGGSKPVRSFTTDNLQWLSVEQAIEDIATFVEKMNVVYKINEPKWILFGCSYAGTLAAWARLKLPDLVRGAVSSSPPLELKVNFWEFLDATSEMIRFSDSACLQDIATATQAIERWIESRKDLDQLKSMFGAEPECDLTDSLNITVFFAQLFYSIAVVVEYGGDNTGRYAEKLTVQKICNIMKNRTISQCAMERYANVIRYITATNEADSFDCDYNKFVREMRWDPRHDFEDHSVWFYQSCKEIGLFQTTDKPGCTPFGKRFGIQYYYRLCKDIFGEELTPEQLEKNVELLNQKFFGKRLNATNVMVINGSDDPYQRVSITKNTGLGPKVLYMYETAHCADVYPARKQEKMELTLGRARITGTIRQWLKQ